MFKNLTRVSKKNVCCEWFSALLINFGIIGVLITALNVSEGRLQVIGDTMEEMAQQHIITEVTVDEAIPVETSIDITSKVEVVLICWWKVKYLFVPNIPVNERYVNTL